MVYLLAVGAALANALTSVLQRMGVEDAPTGDSLRFRLIAHAVRHRVWLAGLGFMVLSFVMQATALHVGRLSEVQPMLTAELLFLVAILGIWFRFPIGWREIVGATAAAVGLSGFLLAASPRGGNLVPSGEQWREVGIACAAVVAGAVLATRRGPRWWRAGMFGVGGAVSYAFAAACTKEVTAYVSHDWVSMFWHWQTYGLAVSGATAVFLSQNAYHAGPIAASQSTLVLGDPIASIMIGIALFGDNLRTSGAYGPLEVLSLIALVGGGIVLSTSPLITGVKGGTEERLADRWRGVQPRHAVAEAEIRSCG